MTTLSLVHIVIETQSPLAIHSGERETLFDNQLARDASGLPYIPSTSITGVWSHLVERELSKQKAEEWFGYASQKVGDEYVSKRSALNISHGMVHDSHNAIVRGLMQEDAILRDTLLSHLYQEKPMHRERVRINDRGVAAENGKFDQMMLPKGVRFSVFVHWSKEATEQDLQILFSCWQDRTFALGGSTRNGLGQVKIVSAIHQQYDLSNTPAQAQAFQQALHTKIAPTDASLPSVFKKQPQAKTKRLASIPLQGIDTWRCGTGSTAMKNDAREADTFTYSERKFTWNDAQKAKLQSAEPVLCSSSIKGILAHRVAYHIRRFNQDWAEDFEQKHIDECKAQEKEHTAQSLHQAWESPPKEAQELFGVAEAEHSDSFAGLLYVDESPVTFEDTVHRYHNAIDRFTGGVRKGYLYSEELLYQPQFTITLWIDEKRPISDLVKKALKATLDDLQNGFLPMGAASGRGSSLVLPDETKQDQYFIDEGWFSKEKEETA